MQTKSPKKCFQICEIQKTNKQMQKKRTPNLGNAKKCKKYKKMQQNIKKNTKHAKQIKNDNPKQK